MLIKQSYSDLSDYLYTCHILHYSPLPLLQRGTAIVVGARETGEPTLEPLTREKQKNKSRWLAYIKIFFSSAGVHILLDTLLHRTTRQELNRERKSPPFCHIHIHTHPYTHTHKHTHFNSYHYPILSFILSPVFSPISSYREKELSYEPPQKKEILTFLKAIYICTLKERSK